MKSKSKLKTRLIRLFKGKQGGAVPTAIKVLTAVVCGAIIMTGLYGVVTNVVLPASSDKVTSMFAYEGSGESGGAGDGSYEGGTGTVTPDPALNPIGTIPEGVTYTQADGTVLTKDDSFPEIEAGDVYAYGDYEYCYGYNWCECCWDWTSPGGCGCDCPCDGWAVRCVNDVAEPGVILETINGEPITSLRCTFAECSEVTVAPAIPSSVTDMFNAFYNCFSLSVAPAIPSGVTDMGSAFAGCSALTTAPEIPSSVTNLEAAFSQCTSLTVAPAIPSSVTDLYDTFWGCTSLTAVPTIPSSVMDLDTTFLDCPNLSGTISIPCHIEEAWYFEECSATFEKYHYDGCGH